MNTFDFFQFESLIYEKTNSFVVIGAFDGYSHDNFFIKIMEKTNKNFNKIIFVEPIKQYFDLLLTKVELLPGYDVICENVAISNKTEFIDMASVKPNLLEKYGWFIEGCACVVENGIPLNTYMKEVELPDMEIQKITAITFEELLSKNNLETVDFLQIDTEGYDERILESIDFEKTGIKFLKFERHYLSEGFLENFQEKLNRLNYSMCCDGENCYFVKNELISNDESYQISKEKTLIITSIFSNLWGTELGGRPSREHHYKVSLLNILNLNPEKVICHTSQEELSQLEQYFYNEKNISRDLLEFKVFDLSTTRYFNKIKSKKDLEFMRSFDRCYEVQYNKLFWCDNLPDLFDYDRIYWFDAGLSHGGLFPEEYSYGEGFDRNFKFNLFNRNFLNYLNNISKDKFILVGKNNEESFYWSTTLPEKYYNNYNKNIHIVGGFFGGPTELYRKVSKMFDDLLVNLLISEDGLFVEEQILTTIYYNSPEIFDVLQFDDWYKRDTHSNGVKYFYNIFEITANQNKNEETIYNIEDEFSIRVKQIVEQFLKEKNLI